MSTIKTISIKGEHRTFSTCYYEINPEQNRIIYYDSMGYVRSLYLQNYTNVSIFNGLVKGKPDIMVIKDTSQKLQPF